MKNKNIYLRYIPMSVVAVLIIFFAVKNALDPADGQDVELWYIIFKTIPTLVTLVVQLLLIAANRYSFLLGGLNALLYGVVYFIEGVPFSGAFSILVSLPIQIYSFFHWKNNSRSGKVTLRWLGIKGRIITAVAAVGVWAICFFFLSKLMVMRIPMFDTIIFSLGIVVTILSAVRFIESQYISLVSNTVSLVMWIILTVADPSNINYVLIGVYNVYCIAQTAINWTLLYMKEKKERLAETVNE